MSLCTRIITSLVLAAGAATITACAVDDAPIETADSSSELAVRPRFELWKDSAGEFRFELVDADADFLVGSEGYTNRTAALNGLLSVVENGAGTAGFKLQTAADDRAYFNLLAANKAVIATSSLYADAAAAQAGVDATRTAVVDYLGHWRATTGARFAVSKDAGGKYAWNLHAKNGEIVLRSERYDSEAAALNGALSVKDNGRTTGRYQVKASTGGRYLVNLTATNGQVIGTTEVYASKSNATRARDALMALIPTVELL